MTEEKIQDYVQGKLSTAEAAEVAAEISRNPELLALVKSYELINEGFRQQRIKKLQQRLLKHHQSGSTSTEKPRAQAPVRSSKPYDLRSVLLLSNKQDAPTTTRISIIDGQPDLANAAARAINSTPQFEVVSVYNNAEDALRKIATDTPDIIIIELLLPKMDGLDCINRLQQQLPKTGFLVFTIRDDDNSVFEALRLGADGYILKQDGIVGLIKAIKEYQHGGAPMSPAIATRVLQSVRSSPPTSPKLIALTERQNEILKLIAQGLSNRQIAEELGLTEGVLKQHVHRIYNQLQVSNRVEAVNLWKEFDKED